MRKDLIISAAIVGMLLSGAAMAQDLSYQVYGQAHVSTDLLNDGDESSVFVSSNNTRFGIKGKYKTDYEAFTVVFQYENNADFSGEKQKPSGISTRNSFAGLQGDWGQLIWGRHDTPVFLLGRVADFFSDRIGDTRNVARDFGAKWDERMHSMIMYTSPLISETVKLNLQHVPAEGRDDYGFFSGSAVYSQSGLTLGLAYELHGKGREAAYADSLYLADVGEAQNSSAIRAVAAYQEGNFKVAGMFQTISNVGGYEDISAMTYGLGFSYKLDSGLEPRAQYYMTDPNTDTDDDGASMLVLGLDYHLNKKARLYLAYAMMMNEDKAEYAPFAGGHGKNPGYGAADPGESPYGVSVGLIASW